MAIFPGKSLFKILNISTTFSEEIVLVKYTLGFPEDAIFV
jgi:hypothetical protein